MRTYFEEPVHGGWAATKGGYVYAKFIVAILGTIVLALNQFAGIDLGSDFATKAADVVIMLLTAIGVFATPNKPQ